MATRSTHVSILVVDIEGYGRRPNPIQASLRTAMYDVVRGAVADCHLPWDEFTALDRGDGILLLVPPATSPVDLAGPLIRALDEGLTEKARMFSAAHAMRLRVALHAGLVEEDTHGWVGEAINTTARLVDAQPLRDTLAAASRAHLAFIVSDEIYRGIIRHEYRFIDASTFRPVRLSRKELDTTAWVHVPGYPAPPGLPPAQTAPPPKGPEPEPPVVASTHIHGDQVFGDKFIGNKNVYGAGPA